MIEAMACGTPVIAWPRGSVPEVIEDGVTGFIVESEADAVAAIERARHLDRRRIRENLRGGSARGEWPKHISRAIDVVKRDSLQNNRPLESCGLRNGRRRMPTP